MAEPTILLRREDGILTLTLNRPEAMNSLSFGMLLELRAAVEEIEGDSAARCLIVTGAGDRAFCAGADLKERATLSEEEVRRYIQTIRTVFSQVENLPIPAIAAVNGAALGGGTELALACDLRIVAENATLGLTETSLAIIPGAGGTQRLPRLVGKAKAKELIFLARRIGAVEALDIGLANQVASQANLLTEAAAMAAAIVRNGPVALKAAKRAIDCGLEMDLASGLVFESTCYEMTIPTEDRREGLAAFREKRAPVYKGR
ncbi:MAG: enoyl-CoA hydratase/isomerase family protein [Deltaproteobacteria bacterium]|nr:enoyl-CoA hydratase/isomerase family protein [Deltaproteobacteria bacterium]